MLQKLKKYGIGKCCHSNEMFSEGEKFIRRTSIQTIPVGDFQMKDIVTRYRKVIWHKFLFKHKIRDENVDTVLSTEELKEQNSQEAIESNTHY